MPEPTVTTEEEKIARLQQAALQLIHLINRSLDFTYAEHKFEGAPEGIFRISGTLTTQNEKIIEIVKGEFNFIELLQVERAALLKRVLRELQDKQAPLFSAEQFEYLMKAKENRFANGEIEKLWSQLSESNKKIASCLIRLLKNMQAKEGVTNMTSANLSMAVAPNLFQVALAAETTAAALTAALIAATTAQTNLLKDLIANADKIPKIEMHLNDYEFPKMSLKGTHYDYQVDSNKKNRFNAFGAQAGKELSNFQNFKGDFLKSKILLSLKVKLEAASADDIVNVVKEIKSSKEYKVLEQGQGIITRLFGLETSSVKAFNKMVEERQGQIRLEKMYSPK